MKPPRTIKVLVVEASSSYRRSLIEGLGRRRNISVVGGAGDALEARELIVAKRPDVQLLDLDIPKMDGIEFLRRLMPQWPLPTVLLTSPGQPKSRIDAALALGALDCVPRVAERSPDFDSMFLEMVPKLRLASTTDVTHWKLKQKANTGQASKRIICIGASTGGTEAIRKVVGGFPADTPGVVIVQHMPVEFTKEFAQRLNREVPMRVKEAEHGDIVQRGLILLAPGDLQMSLRRKGQGFKVTVAEGAKVCGHRPSVEVLFRSAAQHAGNRAVGVMLTGMGDDGAEGMAAMRRAGARTIAQDEASCVVFGMPRVAIEKGGAEWVKPLREIADMVLDLIAQPPSSRHPNARASA